MSNNKKLVKNTKDSSCDALVMFCDSSLRFLNFLKPKYRHCFVAIKSENDWIIYEPLLNRTEITILRNSKALEVRRLFESMGCKVVSTNLNRSYVVKFSMFSPFTCVKAVGKVLGVSTKGIITPYQLYKKLI
ncbi:MAG: hypothetical protein P8N25_02375 [Alphaproteobacteria bacterium]|nr:hypothetical protein [Alphaproteobacteria bacterium]